MKKKLKFKENTLSAKKFNQIIYESNKLSEEFIDPKKLNKNK